MRWRLLVANGLLLGGMAWMALWGKGEQDLVQLLPPKAAPAGVLAGDLGALETQAALAPTAASVSALAGAYLDRDQPGLASAVLERASLDVQGRPEVAHLYARALFHRGRARDALAVAERASAACADTDGACPAWLVAKTIGQTAFFGEVVAAGIDDPHANPEATRAAYERSNREVRLVAMR
jgi:hypothetical protein